MEYVPSKDPSEVKDYTIDWSDDLDTGEIIDTSTFTVSSGLTKDSSSKTDTTTTVWVSGGTAGVEYLAVNTIVTSSARTYERTIIIPVINI